MKVITEQFLDLFVRDTDCPFYVRIAGWVMVVSLAISVINIAVAVIIKLT
jgi:hypothetical protein